jgi:hypothetical protein
MKNKNALYVVLGISAGVVAYYIFCKNKNNKIVGVTSDNTGKKPVETKTNKVGVGGGGGIFSPVAPKPVIPVATTTPLVVNVTSTPNTGTSVSTTPVTKPAMEVVSKPTLEPISTPLPVLATDVVSKPTIEPTSPSKPATEVISKPMSVTDLSNSTTPVTRVDATRVDATQIKSSFQGVGQLCFEVGDCLHDL